MRRRLQLGRAFFAIALLAPSAAFALEETKVEADVCAIATAASAVGNFVTCNFGLTPEQLRQLSNLAVGVGQTSFVSVGEVVANICSVAARGEALNNKVNCNIGPTALVEQIKDVSNKLNINQRAVLALLRIVGEDQSVPEDKLAEALTRVAGDYKRLKAQVAAFSPDNPTARALVEQAKHEIDAGHFARARELLHQATEAQLTAAVEARKLKVQAQAAEDSQMLGAASSTSAGGEVALTEREYRQAAELFARAASYVPPGHPDERGDYLARQADALYQQGDERGDNAALRSAIEVYQHVLQERTRTRVPLDWALTQNNLGNELAALGARERGTARLEAAVAAYRAALEEYTRERVPLD